MHDFNDKPCSTYLSTIFFMFSVTNLGQERVKSPKRTNSIAISTFNNLFKWHDARISRKIQVVESYFLMLSISNTDGFLVASCSIRHVRLVLPSCPPVDLYLISQKSIWRNQVRQTGFLVYFKLDFYCLCSLQKSISKLIFAG